MKKVGSQMKSGASSYSQKRRVLEKQFKGSRLYTLQEATKIMEDILKDQVDAAFVRKYLEEHDCIIIEKKNKKSEVNLTGYREISSVHHMKSKRKKNKTIVDSKGPVENKVKRNPIGMNSVKPVKPSQKTTNKLAASSDKESLNRLIESNLNLVRKIARYYEKSYMKHKLDYDDLVSEGMIALWKAIQGFDQGNGVTFGTYAGNYIRWRMIRAIVTTGTTVRIPIYVFEEIRKVKRLEESYIKINEELNIKEICEKSNISYEKYKELKIIEHRFLNFVSLDSFMPNEDSLELIGVIAAEQETVLGYHNEEYSNPIYVVEKSELVRNIMGLINSLKERERQVLILRLGLIDGRVQTLEEIGNSYGVTRERIRQLEKNALEKLCLMGKNSRIRSLFEGYLTFYDVSNKL